MGSGSAMGEWFWGSRTGKCISDARRPHNVMVTFHDVPGRRSRGARIATTTSYRFLAHGLRNVANFDPSP